MALGDIIPLALFHAKLDEVDKRFYHPCAMSFFPALKFMWDRYHGICVEAKTEGDILGFAFVRDNEFGIVVDANYRNLGIGHKLIECIVAVKPRLWLKVYVNNIKAIKLYKDCGFVITEKGFDSRGRDILRMERN